MQDDLRQATARQRAARAARHLQTICQQLLSAHGELGGQDSAAELIDRLEDLDDEQLDGFFAYLASELAPDPGTVLRHAQAYAATPDAATLIALTAAIEPPRQELLRRLNRMPGGTAAVLRLRRALLSRLPRHPEFAAIEADLLHLLSSWFNPGFLQLRRVDWNSRAMLLEKIILHEAVHTIDGWDDLRRRLQPDRRCFAFFHPQLRDEPLIFVEVALLPDMPAGIGPLIDKQSTPLVAENARVAAFYGISNCEPGLRGVSLGNFLIKTVATQLKRELPHLKTFCTLSPMPGFARWLLDEPDLAALPRASKPTLAALVAARETLRSACGGDLHALQGPLVHDGLGAEGQAALQRLGLAYLRYVTPTLAGDPVARFHLDNGARLERLNLNANLSAQGLRQSCGLMVNYLYDLARVEANHTKFRRGEVVRSAAVAAAE